MNQQPCNLGLQRAFKINSCKYNYYEDFGSNTCKDLPKGYSPFTASLNSLGEAGEAAKRGCKQVVGDFIDRGNPPPNASEFSKVVNAPQ
ncbi:MAG: hypothetical protein VW268_13045 [Rhodospirillaceae bacterium]